MTRNEFNKIMNDFESDYDVVSVTGEKSIHLEHIEEVLEDFVDNETAYVTIQNEDKIREMSFEMFSKLMIKVCDMLWSTRESEE